MERTNWVHPSLAIPASNVPSQQGQMAAWLSQIAHDDPATGGGFVEREHQCKMKGSKSCYVWWCLLIRYNQAVKVRDNQRSEADVQKPCVKPAVGTTTQPRNSKGTSSIAAVLSRAPAQPQLEPCAAAGPGGVLILYIPALPCL